MTSQLGTFPQIQIKIIFQYFSMSLEKLDLGKNLVQFINLSDNKKARVETPKDSVQSEGEVMP